jgi:hypothetical protein
VVDAHPLGVELGGAVGAAGIEVGRFGLRCLLNEAVELGDAGLVDACLGGVFRCIEANGYMALGTEVVDLIGLHLLDDADEVAAVGEVALVENERRRLVFGVRVSGILVEVIGA